MQAYVIALWFLIGLAAPSSNAGHISSAYPVSYGLLFTAVSLLAFLPWRHGWWRFALPPAVVAILLFATALSHALQGWRITYGAFIPYISAAALFTTDLTDVHISRGVTIAFRAVSWVVLAGAAVILIGNPDFNRFLLDHYAMAYDQLLPAMLALHKPVLVFGSHSVAALFYYFFFLANFRAGRYVVALLFVVITLALLSYSGFLLAGIAISQLLLRAFRSHPLRSAIVLVSVFCLIAPPAINFVTNFRLSQYVKASTNGPASRFGNNGALRSDLAYLEEHPFVPIGATFSSRLFAGDCGLVEYMLRGSLLLVLCMYLGLYSFLRSNLIKRQDALLLMGIIVLFETGYSVMGYFRFFCLLPGLVVYLNGVEPGIDRIPWIAYLHRLKSGMALVCAAENQRSA